MTSKIFSINAKDYQHYQVKLILVTAFKIVIYVYNIIGGTHNVSVTNAIAIASKAKIKQQDVCWEIGFGYPVLLLTLASITKVTVLGTDINFPNKVFELVSENLKSIADSQFIRSDITLNNFRQKNNEQIIIIKT